jgi:hypothetical protein
MSYQLTFSEKPTYLHAVATGENSRDTVERYLAEVVRECTARNCKRLLIEERLVGPRLGTIEVFTLAAAASMRYMGIFESVAYVDVNAVGDTMSFAENVAVNRGFPVRIFATVGAAESWLLGEPQRTGGVGPETDAPPPRE